VEFTREEGDLLHKGLKMSFQHLNADAAKVDLVADLATRIGPGSSIYSKVSETMHNARIPEMSRSERDTIMSLRRRINSEHLVLSEADKGNTLVIMDKTEYHQKVTQIIDDKGGVESSDFSFDAHVTEVRKVIRESGHILKSLSIKKALLVTNPPPPRCYTGSRRSTKPGCRSGLSSPTFRLQLTSSLSIWTVGSSRSLTLPLLIW